MSFWIGGFDLYAELSKRTSILGLLVWMLIAAAAAAIVFVLFFFCLCLTWRRRRRRNSHSSHIEAAEAHEQQLKSLELHLQDPTPFVCGEVIEIFHNPPAAPDVVMKIDIGEPDNRKALPDKEQQQKHRLPEVPPSVSTTETSSDEASSGTHPSMGGGVSWHGFGLSEVSHLGWGQSYKLRALEEATGGFAEENIIGEEGYGVVYRGVLTDETTVAIKNLTTDNRGQAEAEFKVEVEAIGRVQHKNLVKLLGYCVEGARRLLVYEYLDNGNLHQWLHGDAGEVSHLTWDIRMKIILGAARGLDYLHEGLEPKVVHRDIKSSNILLDQQWNAKVSDFGLAKLMKPELSHVTTRVMGTFGYVAPEYACTGKLTEKIDVYSFGVLIMEVVSGRAPFDDRRPHGEVNLVPWFKSMLSDRKSELIVDPKMPDKPPSKALKRTLLAAIRCIDPDPLERPKMGHVIHMLEMENLLCRDIYMYDHIVFIKPAPTAASSENESLR